MHPTPAAPPARYVPKHRRQRRSLGLTLHWTRTPRRRAASILLLVSILGLIAGTAASATNSPDLPARSASHPLASTLVSTRYSAAYAEAPAITAETGHLRLTAIRRIARQHRLELLRRQRQLGAMAATVLEPKPAPAPVEAAPEAQEAVEVASSGADWAAIAACESGGDWSINTGNGFWGGLQFTPQTWFAFGGGPFDGVGPFPYSAATQIAVAERVLAVQGPMAWPNCFVWA